MKRAAVYVAVLMVAIAIAAVVISARVATADNPTVSILSAPLKMNVPVILDLNNDGVHTPDELVGVFNVYDGHREIVFAWQPDAYQAAHLDTMAYQVALVQYTLPYTGVGGPFNVYRISHHWAANPNGLVYSMDSFQSEPICYGCPSYIRVVPESISTYLNTTTGVWEYAYNVLPEYATSIPLTGQQQSMLFVLENTPLDASLPASHPGSQDIPNACSATICGDAICDTLCGENIVGGFYYCPTDCTP
jgi:hypothetical protein